MTATIGRCLDCGDTIPADPDLSTSSLGEVCGCRDEPPSDRVGGCLYCRLTTCGTVLPCWLCKPYYDDYDKDEPPLAEPKPLVVDPLAIRCESCGSPTSIEGLWCIRCEDQR